MNPNSGIILQILSKKHIFRGVRRGIATAQEECQYQFQWERWNCPENKASISQEFGKFCFARLATSAICFLLYFCKTHTVISKCFPLCLQLKKNIFWCSED